MISVALAVTAFAACSSSSHSASSEKALLQQECTNVADVLSDGPDPDADPVGYAEAQVLPLRALKINNPTLHKEVQQLADDYKAFSSSNGADTAVAVKVSTVEGDIDSLCPVGVGDQLLPGQAVP